MCNTADWPLISQELTQRSAKYSRINHNCNNTSSEDRTITFDELTNADNEDVKSWWWPQIPLLKKLLEKNDKKESFATWVTLGKYGWDAEKKIPDISWINFLSEDSSVTPDDFSKQLKFLFEDHRKSVSDQQLLVSSDLVDAMNQEPVREDYEPPMAPLLLCFKEAPTMSDDYHGNLMVANWKGFRGKLENKNIDIHSFVKNIGSYLEVLDGLDPIRGFIDNTNWWKLLNHDEKEKTIRRLKGFIIWLHSMPELEHWEMLLTVPPIWHPNKLSGINAVAIVVYVRTNKWIAGLKDNKEELVREINTFVSSFRAGSLVVFPDEVKKYDEAKQRAEKQAQMLDLLIRPLESLTKALAQTRADSQELRAILYEPWEAIFEAQPEIARLFDQREQLIVRSRIIQIKHNPADYDLEDAQFVFAEALRKFYGGREADVVCDYDNGEKVLTIHVVALMSAFNNKNSSYHELAKGLCTVIGEQSWDNVKNNIRDESKIRGYLCNLKERFHKVYKPEEALKPLRWSILRAYLPDHNVPLKVKLNKEICSDDDPIFLLKGSNPLSTLGHLVEFIVSIVATHVCDNEDNRIDATILLKDCPTSSQLDGNYLDQDEASEVVLIFNSNNEWVKDFERLHKLLSQKHLSELRYRDIGEYGDFHKPFVRLIQRIPGGTAKDFKPFKEDGKKCVGFSFPKLSVCFCDKTFAITSRSSA